MEGMGELYTNSIRSWPAAVAICHPLSNKIVAKLLHFSPLEVGRTPENSLSYVDPGFAFYWGS